MNSFPVALVLLLLTLNTSARQVGGSSPAPGVDVIWCDLAEDQLARFTDRDGDGGYVDPFGASRLYRDAGSSPRDVQVRESNGEALVFWVDTVRDVVYRGIDADRDGHLSAVEVGEYRSSKSLDGGSSPDGLEVAADGAVWWSSDAGAHRGLFRLVDLDGNGDANGAGEQQVLVDGHGAHFAEIGTGLAPLDSSALGRLAAVGNGVVAAVHGEDEALYRFEDLDGDGDITGPGESVLFLNASGRNPALPMQPDFASGALPSLQLPNSGGGPTHARLSYLTSLESAAGAGPALILATDLSSTSPFNVDGQALNGRLFRAQDLNGDGDANDSGEVTVWYDENLTGAGVTIDGVVGLDAVGEVVMVADLAGAAKYLHRLEDLNENGEIDSDLEFGEALFSLSAWEDAEPFPSGHAFVVEIAAFPAGLLGDPVLTLSGEGCSPWGTVPRLLGAGQASLGTTELVGSLVDAPPGAPVWLAVGTGKPTWFGQPLPYDLSSFGPVGCTLYLDPFESYGGIADANGAQSWSLLVPYLPVLVDFPVQLQGLVLDSSTGAIALTGLGETVVVAP